MVKNQSLRNSTRAAKGKLSILHKECPRCNHRRAFENMTTVKCCRCGYEMGYGRKRAE